MEWGRSFWPPKTRKLLSKTFFSPKKFWGGGEVGHLPFIRGVHQTEFVSVQAFVKVWRLDMQATKI